MNMKDKIYITGHKHPDTDSIVSAIAYAQLKERKGQPAVACRLGEMQSETKYLLERFHFEEPMLLEDARAKLREIDIDEPLVISPETTIHEALHCMEQWHKQSIGIVDEQNHLLGMITKSDLATIGLGDTALAIQLLQKTPVSYIAKTINGKILHDDPQTRFNGKVSIIAIAETRLKNYELQDRLVIVGDDMDAQLSAIRKGAAILIVVWTNHIEDEVLKQAKANHCSIIISGHGTMNTSRYLFFAPPVKLIMTTELISFHTDDLVSDAEKKMMKSRYRSYPILDDAGCLFGYVSRFHLLNGHNRKMILVDHNEFSQSVKGIEDVELLEVIDHHRIGDIVTNRPISFRNEIIGSTATIIASIYMENQMKISEDLAGLLLGAILSDTLQFKSPTTTEKDKGIAQALSEIAGLDIDTLASDMFAVSSNIRGKTMRELIERDIKYFTIDGCKVMIGQVIISQLSEVKDLKDALEKEMEVFVKDKALDLLVLTFTSILENGSIFYGAGKEAHIVEDAFKNKEGEVQTLQENILSRKNQIVPKITKAILNR